MNKIEAIKDCDIITLEPGDRTKYKFIVIDKDDDYLIISGLETRFYGYEFRKDSIKKFFDAVGQPPPYNEYYRWASDLLHKENEFLSYVRDHTGGVITCNMFTALAAIYAGYIFLTEGNLL